MEPQHYIKKYETYTSMFEIPEEEMQIVETFFADIMRGLDIRTQERIFSKAETIHRLIQSEELRDDSIMIFEFLFLTISIRTKNKSMKWLIDKSRYANIENGLGTKYYNMLKEYEHRVSNTRQSIDGNAYIWDDIIGKTFFWVANLYGNYQDGICEPYYYNKQAGKRMKL